jgi:hypothetical protein
LENINGVPTVAGWHDDPADPNFIRYSNGRAWTGERVAKEHTLKLKNDNVYRPGGSIGSMPEKEEVVVEAETASYQPLTRKERRILENAETPALEPMSDLFEDEFEFQTAPAMSSRSYAPGEDEAAKRREIPVIDDVPPIAELSLFDGFEDVFPQEKEPESPEAEDAEPDRAEDSLPSLDMGDTFSSAVPVPRAAPVPSDDNDETSFLPTLGGSGSSDLTSESLPSLESMDHEEVAPADDDDEEFFTSSVSADVVEEDVVEDDFIAVEPIIVARRSYEAPPTEAKDEPKETAKRDEAPAVFSPVVVPDSTKIKAPENRIVDSFDDDLVDDEQPSFGFTSKLGRSFKKEDEAEIAPAAPVAPLAMPKPEEKLPPHLADEEDPEDNDVQRDGIGGRFKSFFGKGRSQEVLDYNYEDENPETDALPEPKPQPKTELKEAVAAPPKAVVSVATADTEDDEPEEEPTIRTGIFSSRQDKEDAAVEVELVDRLNKLAKRVASLKKEEVEVLARVEAAKLQEKELNALVIQAHETHELLDQLAKTRQKELEGKVDEKEDDHFIEFLNSHGAPDVEDEQKFEPSTESTVALPVIKEEREKEDDESESSPLPELKFN